MFFFWGGRNRADVFLGGGHVVLRRGGKGSCIGEWSSEGLKFEVKIVFKLSTYCIVKNTNFRYISDTFS